MSMADKIPNRIVELIKARGPLFSAELAALLDIDQDDIFNATRKPIRDGILKDEKASMPGYKTKRKFNKYSLAGSNHTAEDQLVIRKIAQNGDSPKIAEGEFNPADPFRLARKEVGVEPVIKQAENRMYIGVGAGVGVVHIPKFLEKSDGEPFPAVSDAKSATILDNDEPEPAAFECGYTPSGGFRMIRNGNYTMTLTAAEAEAVKRCMDLFP